MVSYDAVKRRQSGSATAYQAMYHVPTTISDNQGTTGYLDEPIVI